MAGSHSTGLRAHRGIALRTPLLPFETFSRWIEGGANQTSLRTQLMEVVAQPAFREALWLASPRLYQMLDGWLEAPSTAEGLRIERSLVRYVARAAYRLASPGLLSGVSAGTLGTTTAFTLSALDGYERRTGVNNDYLWALADELAGDESNRSRLTYRPNSSLSFVARRWCWYSAAPPIGGVASYQLSSVEPDELLDRVLRYTLERARSGTRLDDLAQDLGGGDPELTSETAIEYLHEFVDAQILIPDLGVQVTGREPIETLLDQLATAEIDLAHGRLVQVREEIAALDITGLGVSPARYEALASKLGELPANVELPRLFQVDMYKPAIAQLSVEVAAEVAHVVEWLGQVAPAPEATSLDTFINEFIERFEGREVPLVEVLDQEIGIGFESSGGLGIEELPLLAGLRFPDRMGAARVSLDRFQIRLLQRLVEALARGDDEIILGDEDLSAGKPSTPRPLPDALSAVVSIAGPLEDPTILFHAAVGPSGARLLSRFCHLSPEIADMVGEHLRAEEALRPDAIFAEVVYLNGADVSDTRFRPVLRQHEIAFLGRSGADSERTISVDDLWVSVRGTRIVLTSRRLGREIIPRLSTGDNFQQHSPSVYRFLCALQGQGCTERVSFSWGMLSQLPRLPRVRIGRTVVARASFRLDKTDLDPLTAVVRETSEKTCALTADEQRAAVRNEVARLRERRRLPRWLVLFQGADELPIDLDNPLLVDVFAEEVAGQTDVVVIELFPIPDAIVRGPEGAFANELVLTFTRPADRAREITQSGPMVPARLARSFDPGSEWAYAKIYCGEATADRVLRAVTPFVRRVMAEGIATHWFFIRYGDPHHHVRLRFHGNPGRLAGELVPALHEALGELRAQGAIHRVQLDRYTREVERYGGEEGIELCEKLFWIDSEVALGILELLDGDDDGAASRWRLALRGSVVLLDALGLTPEQQRRLFASASASFSKEHNADAALARQLDERYREQAKELDLLLARDAARDRGHELEAGFDILMNLERRMPPWVADLRRRDAAGKLAPRLDEFAWSLVHMHCNRLFHGAQRAQEMVLYDYASRWHEDRWARTNGAPSDGTQGTDRD